jgi:hypothetical protein
MNLRSFCAGFVLAISMVLAAQCLWAQDGIERALSRANLASQLDLSDPLGRTLAVADFDNDRKLDGAVLFDSGRLDGQNTFRIDLHLSDSGNSELIFESAEIALAIEALDVNEDGATDVVVERTLSRQHLYVWLNDGHGDFHYGRIEDFQSDSNPRRKQFEVGSSRPDCATACLAPQRGIEAGKLAMRSASGLPPSSGQIKVLARSSSPISHPFSVDFSRAPPLSL